MNKYYVAQVGRRLDTPYDAIEALQRWLKIYIQGYKGGVYCDSPLSNPTSLHCPLFESLAVEL